MYLVSYTSCPVKWEFRAAELLMWTVDVSLQILRSSKRWECGEDLRSLPVLPSLPVRFCQSSLDTVQISRFSYVLG